MSENAAGWLIVGALVFGALIAAENTDLRRKNHMLECVMSDATQAQCDEEDFWLYEADRD